MGWGWGVKGVEMVTRHKTPSFSRSLFYRRAVQMLDNIVQPTCNNEKNKEDKKNSVVFVLDIARKDAEDFLRLQDLRGEPYSRRTSIPSIMC